MPPTTRTLSRKIHLRTLALLLLLSTCLFGLCRCTGPKQDQADEVPKWLVHEILLTARDAQTNLYLEAGVEATFEGPGGRRQTVRGFWDGDSTFRVRFTPTAEGDWAYSTRSADPGLDGQTGRFRCMPPAPGDHGFVRRDPEHPYHFVYDDGTRYFMFGTTY
jgi:hypothetical protein